MTLPHRIMSGFCRLWAVLARGALVAAAEPDFRAPAHKGSAKRPALGVSRQEALQRFRQMSPEQRLPLVDRLFRGEQPFHEVKRGLVSATVVERGVLEPAEATDVVCRLKARNENNKVAS